MSVEKFGAREDFGASSIEYALLVTLIAGAIVAALIALGPVVEGLYDISWP